MGFNQVLISCFKEEKMIEFCDDVQDDYFEDIDELKIWHAMQQTNSNKMEDLFPCWKKYERIRILGIAMEISNIVNFQRHDD